MVTAREDERGTAHAATARTRSSCEDESRETSKAACTAQGRPRKGALALSHLLTHAHRLDPPADLPIPPPRVRQDRTAPRRHRLYDPARPFCRRAPAVHLVSPLLLSPLSLESSSLARTDWMSAFHAQARHDSPRDHQPRPRLVTAYPHPPHPLRLDLLLLDQRRNSCSSRRAPPLSERPPLPPHRLLRPFPLALHLNRPRLLLRPRPRLLLEPSSSRTRRRSPRTHQARTHSRGRQVRRGRLARHCHHRRRTARRERAYARPACGSRCSRRSRIVWDPWSGGRSRSGRERLCPARTSSGRRTWWRTWAEVGAAWWTEGWASGCSKREGTCGSGVVRGAAWTGGWQEGERGRRRREVR